MARPDPLERLRVVMPCLVPWAGMAGDDQVRFCDRCRKSVYNIAAMTRAEALEIIERSEGDLCVRLTRRGDGTVVAGDCRARLREGRRRGVVAFAGALLVVALQLWAQVFGLRALRALVRPESRAAGAVEQQVMMGKYSGDFRPTKR